MRYKAWRSHSDKWLRVIHREDEFDELPDMIRHLGPWTGAAEGDIDNLRPHYRMLLAEQGFVLIYQPAATFNPEC